MVSVSFSLSHWYPGSDVVLDCIDSGSLHTYFVDERSPTSIRPLQTCLHSKSVPAWPLCMLKRFAENDFERRPNADLIAIFVKPLQILLQPISDWQSISHNEVIALAIYLGSGL